MTTFGDRVFQLDGVPVDGYAWAKNIWYVDSGSGSDSYDGKSYDRPFATLDYAVGKCTANQGDIIFVMPGHAETVVSAAAIDLDVAGIYVIGLGTGTKRPTFTSGTSTAATVEIGAANITVKNLLFICGKDAQSIMLDINSTDAVVDGCEFRGTSSYQPTTMVDINGGGANACDRTTVRNCVFVSETAGAAQAVELGEVADRVIVEDCLVYGDWSNAGIHNPTGKICTNLILKGNVVANVETGDHAIELVSACTGYAVDNRLYADTLGTILDPGSLKCLGNLETDAIDQAGVDSPRTSAGGLPDDSITNASLADDTILGADNNNNDFASTSVAANEDGSIIERLEQIQEAVNIGTGTSLGANKSLVDALGTNGAAVSDSATSVLGAIGANNNNNAFDSSTVAANADGSVLEREEWLQAAVGTLANSGGTATLGGILGDVANSTVAARLATIDTVVDGIAQQAARTTAAKAITSVATANLFTVANGPVRLLAIVGNVTTGFEAAGNNTKLVHTATGASGVDLCAVLDVTGAAQYSNLSITGTLANAMVNSANGVHTAQATALILNPGTLSLNCAGTSTGAATWYVLYEPLAPGATMTAVA